MLKKLLSPSLAALLILAVVLSGCGGGKSSRTPTADPVIYVGGWCVDAGEVDGVYTACYWVDGVRRDLDGDDLVYLSFYNNQLYAVGTYNVDKKKKVPRYWINGVRNDMADADKISDHTIVSCGFVYNGEVYAGGFYYDGSNHIPCYWDSSCAQHNLPSDIGFVDSIFVDDSGVYAAGRHTTSTSYQTICYWDEKGRHDVSKLDGSIVTQIVVDNNNVYLSGKNSGGACYWICKDGSLEMTKQLDGDPDARATSIFVGNNQIYAGGYYNDGGKHIPCYWDGAGTRHNLANPGSDSAEVYSIFVYNGKVYAAGSYYNDGGEVSYACYWDDMGRRHGLDYSGNVGSYAKCILVR